MLAAAEMRISGEPFAEALGLDLAGYNRFHMPPDLYFDPGRSTRPLSESRGVLDQRRVLRVSKQAMNDTPFEAGAGLARLRAARRTRSSGDAAADAARRPRSCRPSPPAANALGRVYRPAPTAPRRNVHRQPARLARQVAGLARVRELRSAITPTATSARLLDRLRRQPRRGRRRAGAATTSATRLAPPAAIAQRRSETESPRRGRLLDVEVQRSGTINYLQGSMHDANGYPVTTSRRRISRDAGDPGNPVVGMGDVGSRPAGTFLGSSDIEGFQAQLFVADDRQPRGGLARHAHDGRRRDAVGFATLTDALAYDDTAPLRWFPGRTRVTETDAGSGLPQPRRARLADRELMDLVGVPRSATRGVRADRQAQRRRRRLHRPRRVSSTAPVPGRRRPRTANRPCTIARSRWSASRSSTWIACTRSGDAACSSTTPRSRAARPRAVHDLADLGRVRHHRRCAPRCARCLAARAVLEQHAGHRGCTIPLDALGLHYRALPPCRRAARRADAARDAALLYDHLTEASGRAYAGWDLLTDAPVDDERHARRAHRRDPRPVRGVPATGETRYRARAIAGCDRMEAVFYDPTRGSTARRRAPGRRGRVHAAAVRAAAERAARRVRAGRDAAGRRGEGASARGEARAAGTSSCWTAPGRPRCAPPRRRGRTSAWRRRGCPAAASRWPSVR